LRQAAVARILSAMPDAPALEVRPATPADRAALVGLLLRQLQEHAIETPEDAIGRAVDRLLDRPEAGRLLLAFRDGTPVGVAALSFVSSIEHGGHSAWLEELYVDPPHRGRGIGTVLLRAACDAAAAAGATAVDLEVEASHGRAAGLYLRAGFRPLPRTRFVRTLV
jgi:GNAT superfamily N-acetyltransferase